MSIELKNPVTGEPYVVENLTDPLTITFFDLSTPRDGKKLACKFFDTKKQVWAQDGLTAVDSGNNTVVCESTHATFFAPSHDAVKNASTAAPTTADVEGMDSLIVKKNLQPAETRHNYNLNLLISRSISPGQ